MCEGAKQSRIHTSQAREDYSVVDMTVGFIILRIFRCLILLKNVLKLKLLFIKNKHTKVKGEKKKSQEYGAPTDFTPSAGAPYGKGVLVNDA